MQVRATTENPPATGADTIIVGLFDSERITHDTEDAALAALIESGEARSSLRALAQTHADGKRWIIVGLGARKAFTAERARVAAATALCRARELNTKVLCWEVPHELGDDIPAALVEGTILASYRFDSLRSRSEDDDPQEREILELIVSAHHDVSPSVARGMVTAAATNRARDLGNLPPNMLRPADLTLRARAISGVSVEAWGREEIEAAGMGAFAAVARGAEAEPQLITLRYEPPEATGPLIGLVGKAVTFDSGGYTLKPAAKMHEMKFDMCGGAAVLEAIAAVGELGLPIRLVGVIGATENRISERAMLPGEVVRTRAGHTVEIDNTDAEGRLVLADCITHARDQGAERLIDIATLTGGIVVALGGVYAGLMGNDDAWCDVVSGAGDTVGERVWRLPLDEEYDEMIAGKVGDLLNNVEGRSASSIVAAAFLARFAGDVPWAHLDIAGVAWGSEKPYARRGASGWGVRLLIELATRLSG